MGGRGASFGGGKHKYGTEYKTIPGMQFGRVKFVKQIDLRPQTGKSLKPQSVKAPQETQTRRRIYVTVNEQNTPTVVSFYRKGKIFAQVDLTHRHPGVGMPHVHYGYEHGKKGTRNLYKREEKLLAKVYETWHNR